MSDEIPKEVLGDKQIQDMTNEEMQTQNERIAAHFDRKLTDGRDN